MNMTKHEPRQATCDWHGVFESRHIFGSIWSKCQECSAEATAKEKSDRERRDKDATQEAWQRRIGYAGIPDRFSDRSLKSYVAKNDGQRRALAFAEAYADGFDGALAIGRSAIFIGKPGTGKTHLAVGIGLRVMHRDGRTVLFSTVMRAIRRVRNTWNRDAEETETKAIEALTQPDLLILDEVGVQYGSDAEKLLIFDILNERYENRRPTLLLSNLELVDVRAYLGERVYDRLREDDGEVIVFDWESHRCAS